MISYRDWRRAAALEAAATRLAGLDIGNRGLRGTAERVEELASHFERWLGRPYPIAAVEAIVGTPQPRTPEGPTVSLVMPDDDMVTITVTALDKEKVPVADTFTDPNGMFVAPFTWVEDNTDLGELVVAADTLSANLRSHVGQTGTLTITITDANGKALAPVSVEIDPGAPASVAAVFGAPVARDDNPPA